jgi:cytochrome c553
MAITSPGKSWSTIRSWARSSIAYLKTIPAVDAVIPAKRVGPLARVLSLTTDFPLIEVERVPTSGPRARAVPRGATRQYGDYLATTGSCKSCHLDELSGGTPMEKNLLSSNLTPAGIGKWTEADFTKSLREGTRPDGRVLSAVMPWPYTRLMSDDEIHALWLYIRSVPSRKTGSN